MNSLLARLVVVLLAFMFMHPVFSEPIKGEVGASSRWGAGWIDLDVLTTFKRGDKIKLKVGGIAKTIVVRFLSRGHDPNDPVGIDGGVVEVPKDKVVQITLNEDHEDVVQISVHGGPNPFGLYQMWSDNGPATILSAERVAP